MRRGSAGSNTTSDHLQVLGEAIAALPPKFRRRLMVTADGAGASHGLITRLDQLAARPGHQVTYSVGWETRWPRARRAWITAFADITDRKERRQRTSLGRHPSPGMIGTGPGRVADAAPADLNQRAPGDPRHRGQSRIFTCCFAASALSPP
jgi:hypothetical protein